MNYDYVTERVSVSCPDRSYVNQRCSMYRLYEYIMHYCEHAAMAGGSSGSAHPQTLTMYEDHGDMPDCYLLPDAPLKLEIDGETLSSNDNMEIIAFAQKLFAAKSAVLFANYHYEVCGTSEATGWDTDFHPAYDYMSSNLSPAFTDENVSLQSIVAHSNGIDDGAEDTYEYYSSPYGEIKILNRDELLKNGLEDVLQYRNWYGDAVSCDTEFSLSGDRKALEMAEKEWDAFIVKYNLVDDLQGEMEEFQGFDSVAGRLCKLELSAEMLPVFLEDVNRLNKLAKAVSEDSKVGFRGDLICADEGVTAFIRFGKDEKGNTVYKSADLK